jgi:hypothetical protein
VTTLRSAVSIDISVIAIARWLVRLTRLCEMSAIVECVAMPSMPPVTLQPSIVTIP